MHVCADEHEVAGLRANIVVASRRNFVLERELNELDEKIKLLIKNRISVQEVLAQQQGLLQDKEDGKGSDVLKGKLGLYEDLFYLLQTKPQYFAKLARHVPAKDIPAYVQTVVFDMYGDQYDTREERLLLSLFKQVIQMELDSASDQGSLFRANTAITQMLSAYARRGQGLSVLKEILEEPLKSLVARKDLNLEINPSKASHSLLLASVVAVLAVVRCLDAYRRVVLCCLVLAQIYTQLIQDYETQTGKTSPLPKSVSDDDAAKNADVQKVVAQRTSRILCRCPVLSRVLAC